MMQTAQGKRRHRFRHIALAKRFARIASTSAWNDASMTMPETPTLDQVPAIRDF
jgi:hypothetical protein